MNSLSRQLALPFRVPPAGVPRAPEGPAASRRVRAAATPSAADPSARRARAVPSMEALA